MSEQSVDRLKELLFERERAALNDMSRRLDLVFDRAGSEGRFRASVADVIDGALRDAEVARHRELADAIAPVVVRTVRNEITASQDLLVEALYPKTGELVRRYVSNAIKDLTDDINRRLENGLPINRVLLKMKSLVTGRSMAELAIAGSQRFEVEELFLIRRGSGELVQHWSRPGAAPSSQGEQAKFSGVLAAITGFADQTFQGDAAELRQLEMGDRTLYVRASPAHLLAARVRSPAPPSIEALLDAEFLRVLDASRSAGTLPPQRNGHGDAGHRSAAPLADLAARLESEVRERQLDQGQIRGGISPLKTLAYLVLVPLLAWGGWRLYERFHTDSVRHAAVGALDATAEIKGYPIQIDVARWGGTVVVKGLAPGGPARDRLIDRVRAAVPGSLVVDQLGLLPEVSLGPDPGPALAEVRGSIGSLKEEVRGNIGALKDELSTNLGALDAEQQRALAARLVERASARLARVSGELRRLSERDAQPEVRQSLRELTSMVEAAASDLGGSRVPAKGSAPGADRPTQPTLTASIQRLREAVARGLATAGRKPESPRPMPDTFPGAAEELSLLAERIAEIAGQIEARIAVEPLERRVADLQAALARLAAVKPAPPAPPQPAPSDPRQVLEAWTRANAIFFANGSDYRDERVATAALEELVLLLKDSTQVIRVIGHTDERGGPSTNQSLALLRAQKVATALTDRGVPRSRLVIVARTTGHEISSSTGATSPNRRVSFEVAYRGEGGDP